MKVDSEEERTTDKNVIVVIMSYLILIMIAIGYACPYLPRTHIKGIKVMNSFSCDLYLLYSDVECAFFYFLRFAFLQDHNTHKNKIKYLLLHIIAAF